MALHGPRGPGGPGGPGGPRGPAGPGGPRGPRCLLVLVLFLLFGLSSCNHEWDIIIFTQHWPVTVCSEWKGEDSSHTCVLPSQKDAWTIHGVWPTKLETRGPNFCNSSLKFDDNAIKPIKMQLEQYWINIEKETPLDSFWKHEWQKHGTCAMSDENLNSELKYFAQGLRWLQLYSMSNILSKAGIVPSTNKTYSPVEVYNAVKKSIGKDPVMNCHKSKQTGQSLMFEIKICFDKNLNLTDCDGVKRESDDPHLTETLLHCDLTQNILYIDEVPKLTESYGQKREWSLVDLYHWLMFLQWFTL